MKNIIQRIFTRELLFRWGIFLGIVLLLFILRTPILRGVGNFLITETEEQKSEYAVVLGGNIFDRANHVIQLYKEDKVQQIICVGGNTAVVLRSLNVHMPDAQIYQRMLIENGVDSADIRVLPVGTSTREEAQALRDFCKQENIDELMVISDKFHLRRARMVFREFLDELNIKLLYSGSKSSVYNENEWWKYEEGLIMVNNEYVKLFYYLLITLITEI